MKMALHYACEQPCIVTEKPNFEASAMVPYTTIKTLQEAERSTNQDTIASMYILCITDRETKERWQCPSCEEYAFSHMMLQGCNELWQ
jgi:hypothetical protein